MSYFDLRPAVEAVIDIEKSDSIINIENSDLVINIENKNSNIPNTMELDKLYEIVTPTGVTNTFEENIIKTQTIVHCYLPLLIDLIRKDTQCLILG